VQRNAGLDVRGAEGIALVRPQMVEAWREGDFPTGPTLANLVHDCHFTDHDMGKSGRHFLQELIQLLCSHLLSIPAGGRHDC
jgi:hypothetical protein